MQIYTYTYTSMACQLYSALLSLVGSFVSQLPVVLMALFYRPNVLCCHLSCTLCNSNTWHGPLCALLYSKILPISLKGCGWLLLPLMYLSHFDIYLPCIGMYPSWCLLFYITPIDMEFHRCFYIYDNSHSLDVIYQALDIHHRCVFCLLCNLTLFTI